MIKVIEKECTRLDDEYVLHTYTILGDDGRIRFEEVKLLRPVGSEIAIRDLCDQ
jgi:hypothetical protein